MSNINLETGNRLDIQFNKDGLAPAVVQETISGEILMFAWVNSEALETSIKSGFATFWSRSRQELWKKGETSGNMMKIQDILVDCDQDCIIYKVEKTAGGACHTKNEKNEYRHSCFYRKVNLENGKLVYVEK
ncbi:MAG: phosphoribosyl-AMP cyclohydrolase [Bacteroidales bacterium]|nr:phosphoribosyl-AMP cyclohydrolase [Bacteroidales bacterium]MBN2818873.1 phosphoribosyl-AMP cyclohydrolase [Bacteroidales bacterium]